MNLQEYKNQKNPTLTIWDVKLEKKDIKILVENEEMIILRIKGYPQFQYTCIKEIGKGLWATRKGKDFRSTCFILNFNF